MIAVWKREMGQYFKTTVGYLFLGLFTLLCGLMFAFFSIKGGGGASLYVLLSGMRLPFMLIAPLLTMRLMAQERRSRTDQLLMTSPITIPAIVLGKAFAAYTMLLLAQLLTLFFPLLIARYASVSVGVVFSTSLGFFLMNMVTLSIGMVMSTLCMSQISAGVATLGVNMLLYLLEGYVLPQMGASYLAPAYAVVSALSLSARFASFQNGVVSLTQVVYFLSVSGLMLLISGVMVSRRRWAKG